MRAELLALKTAVYVLMPATAWATSITLHETLMHVPMMSWLMVGILSTVWGLAALLAALKGAGEVARPVVFTASHMLGSWVAGCSMFLLAESADMPDLAEALSIGTAAYCGARFMDWLASRLTGPKP